MSEYSETDEIKTVKFLHPNYTDSFFIFQVANHNTSYWKFSIGKRAYSRRTSPLNSQSLSSADWIQEKS